MKKRVVSLFLAVFMVFLVGCTGGTAEDNIQTETPTPATTAVPAPVEIPAGRLYVTVTEELQQIMASEETEQEVVLVDFYCQTPVVSGSNAQKINEVLQAKYEDFTTGTGGEGNPQSLLDYKEAALRDYSWRKQDGLDPVPFELSRRVNVARGDEAVISFVYDEYSYTGGSHGLTVRSGLTFRSDGAVISFEDLAPDMKALRSFCEKYMATQSRSAEYAQYSFHYDYQLTLPYLLKDNNWYLSPKGLVIIANPYDIAPYAFGRIEFTIPYDQLDGLVYDWVIPASAEPDGTLWGTYGSETSPVASVEYDNGTNGQGVDIRLSASGSVSNLRLTSVRYNEYTGGFDDVRLLWYATSLANGDALRLLTNLPENEMSDLKISYQGKNDREQVWYVSKSGVDGALVLLDGADFTVLPKNVTEELPFRYDLDNDGANEIVNVRPYHAEDMGGMALQIVVTESDGAEYVANTIAQWNYDLWLADGDGDARPEIYFSGDIASDDYVLYGWHYDGTGFKPMEFRDKSNVSNQLMGQIVSVDGSRQFTIASARYILGTYNGTRPFAIGVDGVFAPVQDSCWSFDRNEFWLELSCELKAELNGEAVILPTGSHILLTGTDGESWVEFYTEDYTTGRLSVSPSQTHSGWRVAGVEEMEAFVALPYYG